MGGGQRSPSNGMVESLWCCLGSGLEESLLGFLWGGGLREEGNFLGDRPRQVCDGLPLLCVRGDVTSIVSSTHKVGGIVISLLYC